MESEPVQDAAAAAAAEQLRDLLNASDVETVKQSQFLILGRLQDSNAVLSHFNDFSQRSFTAVAKDFSNNTRLLKQMKADLDLIFKRIRNLKSRIASEYPDAFDAAVSLQVDDRRPDLDKAQ